MYVSMKDILTHADKHNYAVMTVNSVNMEMARAVITAAEEVHSPIIINIGVGQMANLAHPTEMVPMIKEMAERATVPVALNLDHGQKFEDEVSAIQWGFSSVMIDASSYPYEENVKRTATIAALAHQKGICVEGELGHVGQAGDGDNSKVDLYTNVEQAVQYVKDTGVDALAVAGGINKINVCTDAFHAAEDAMKAAWEENPSLNYMQIMMVAEQAIKKFVKDYIRVIGSNNQYVYGETVTVGNE